MLELKFVLLLAALYAGVKVCVTVGSIVCLS